MAECPAPRSVLLCYATTRKRAALLCLPDSGVILSPGPFTALSAEGGIGPTFRVRSPFGVRRFIAAFFPGWQYRHGISAVSRKAAINRRTPKLKKADGLFTSGSAAGFTLIVRPVPRASCRGIRRRQDLPSTGPFLDLDNSRPIAHNKRTSVYIPNSPTTADSPQNGLLGQGAEIGKFEVALTNNVMPKASRTGLMKTGTGSAISLYRCLTQTLFNCGACPRFHQTRVEQTCGERQRRTLIFANLR